MKLFVKSSYIYLLGVFTGFCLSVLSSYITMTSTIKSKSPRQLHAAPYVTRLCVGAELTTASNNSKSQLNTSYVLKTSQPPPLLKTSPKVHPQAEGNGSFISETPLQRYVKHVRFHSQYVNCSRIFDGNQDEIARANNYSKTHSHSLSDTNFISLTQDCDAFKKELGYVRKYSKEETDFPLAFGLLTHEKIEQVERLLRILYAPQNTYCIHVDAKSPPEFIAAVKSLTKCFPNVFVTSRLEIVTYAHFSRLRAEFNCIEDLLNKSSTWKYYLNLATSEIPLKTNLQIVKYLERIKGDNDIAESVKGVVPKRYLFRHVISEGHVIRTRLKLPPPPYNLTMAKGQAYGAFNRKFLEFVLSNKMAKDFLVWCKDTHSPDEHYWATLNNLYDNPFLESPGGSKMPAYRTRYNGRFVKWMMKVGYCKGVFRHKICVYGAGDLVDLKSVNKLVANKFNVDFDPFAVACMEEFLRNKRLAEIKPK